MPESMMDKVTQIPVEQTEAYEALLDRVGRKSPTIPAPLLVRHILACVPAEEWPVRVEAMDALLRRLEAAKRDGLRISARPEDGKPLGLYATIQSVEVPQGSPGSSSD